MNNAQKRKILISARKKDFLIKKMIERLGSLPNLEISIHDPTSDFLNLTQLSKVLGDVDLLVVKAAGESSTDILHAASLNSLPTLNNSEAVSICRNKIALDIKLRNVFSLYNKELTLFHLPRAWLHPSPLRGLREFKQWATQKLPLVFKSHDQHNEFFRFNFLALTSQEIDDFIVNYKDFLYFDLYIQEFIECDGFDRKIYVCGEEVFGIMRENPIYIYLREKPDDIDVKSIKRTKFQLTPEIKKLALILAEELHLDIFGFDLIKTHSEKEESYFLIDLNDFPGFQGVKNADKIITEYIIEYMDFLRL
ncbi:MAG: Inositol 1, 3, 4-trisphosphate 5/6-kinase [Promethearchaeota archaeon]|nr:MAG: Inositol 1, 3, 4-trisphosphate 5/6-kinase [Candidatus Lokiarchaeota archaeon]